jgi:CHAD domain-containing protein
VAGWALAETEVGPLIEEATVRLAALTRASAPARDLDVLLDALRAETTSADELAAVERLVDDWADRRRDARAAAIAGLDGGDLAWLRAPFRVAMERCASDLTLRGPTVRRAAPPLLDRTMRRLRQRARVGPAPTSEQLHDLRIAAKRFRYSCELVLSAFGRTFQEPVAVATALQDALGQIHDDDLATGTLLAELPRLAADPARAGDVAVLTRLIELRRARRDDLCRTAQELWTRLPRRRELARRLRERNL